MREGGKRGIFVVGTDTGVGKTLVAAALARYLVNLGVVVRVVKPVETGVPNPEALGPDGNLLRWAAGNNALPEEISPYRFHLPLAPSLAAEKEGVRIDLQTILDRISPGDEKGEFWIVEGAGGLMVPLAGGFTVADLALRTDLPLLIVARPGLGTINHTLLTVMAARTMSIPVAGIIVNGMPERPDLAEESAPHALASLASAPLLGVLSKVTGDDRTKVSALVNSIPSLPSLPWLHEALGLPRQAGLPRPKVVSDG